MLKKCIGLLVLTSLVFVNGEESSPGTPKDPSSLRQLNKHISNIHAPKTQWTYHPEDGSHRHAHSHGSTLKATQGNFYEHPNDSGLPQEYWWQNFTRANYYDYSKPTYGYSTAPSGAASGFLYKDSLDKIHSRYPYPQIRPATGSKKIIANYFKDKLQGQTLDASGQYKFKKTALYQSPSNYKKIIFSRGTKPYTKHKYSAQSYPFYRRYLYQSPYQRYAIFSNEMLRYKDKSPVGGYYKTSTSFPSQDTTRHHTTERMDDAYPDGSTTWEDYPVDKERNHNASGNYYEETYDEVEKENSDLKESAQEEGTTRGYYGDRIYMSTHGPLITAEKTGVKNKYFIIRRTSHDDDIETLFE